MNAKSEKDVNAVEEVGEHGVHGLEDIADVLVHGAAGAVKGVADGVESASAQTQAREDEK